MTTHPKPFDLAGARALLALVTQKPIAVEYDNDDDSAAIWWSVSTEDDLIAHFFSESEARFHAVAAKLLSEACCELGRLRQANKDPRLAAFEEVHAVASLAIAHPAILAIQRPDYAQGWRDALAHLQAQIPRGPC